jgi:uncharacterized membrane protein YphA (DoxX/SURF4 family)
LLLLRVTVGVLILLQAESGLKADINTSTGAWISGALGLVAGCLLLAGFLTPIAAVLAALDAAGVWLAMIPPSHPDLSQSRLLAAFLTALSAAIVLLGPGAFSIDARLFGLREIIIPGRRSDP